MCNLNLRQYIIVSFVLLLGIILNIFLFESWVIGLIFGLGYILFFSLQLGLLFFAQKEKGYQVILGALFLIVLIILTGTACYYIYGLPNWMVCLVLILIPWIVFIFKNSTIGLLTYHGPRTKKRSNSFGSSLIHNLGQKKFLTILYLILWLVLILVLFNYQTLDSIRSPWEVVPKAFIVVYFIATTTLTIIILSTNSQSYRLKNLILISLHLFLTLSVALIVYQIGYGFDGFIHRATQKVIYDSGSINPKPFYYIGQYSLIVILSKLIFVKLSLIDKLILPLLASIFLPALSYFSFKNIFSHPKILLLTTGGLLLIATPLFFYSVPQALANLLLLILILLAIPYLIQKHVMPYFLWLIALACFVIHPLAGIPALIFTSLLYILSKKQFKHPLLLSLYGLGAAVCIPVFFWLGSLVSSQLTIKLSANNLIYFKSIFTNFLNFIPFYSIYHLVYFYKFNILLLLFGVIIIGTVYLIKKKHPGVVLIYLLLTCLLFINLFLMGFLEFSSLINYEQGEFIRRLWQIMGLFLVPMFLAGVYVIIQKILLLKPYKIANLRLKVSGKFILILLTASILTISLYLNYPHVDAFEKTRGYSVSQADIEAVYWIEENANGKDYVVLANQATAAAALQEYGFKKYFINQKSEIRNHQLFYYPIPTSSPLYDLYLKMVYDQPRLEYIEKARGLTGASLVYFVINDYWLDAKKRTEQAKLIADGWQDVDGGKVWVFRFE